MRKINILGRDVEIQTKELDKDTDGEFDRETYIISINNDLEGDELIETVIHECLHCLFDRLNLNQVVEEQVEEIIVSNIAQFFTETFNFDEILSHTDRLSQSHK